MTGAGEFSPLARAAILEATLGRCAGCGRVADSCQHRRARGMGGTSDVSIGHPANGVGLCGGALAGVRGCHGWAEAHPLEAELLGWRLAPGAPALGAPFYALPWQGWRAWGEDHADLFEARSAHSVKRLAFPFTVYVDEDDLDRWTDRAAAVARLHTDRPPPAEPYRPKPTR